MPTSVAYIAPLNASLDWNYGFRARTWGCLYWHFGSTYLANEVWQYSAILCVVWWGKHAGCCTMQHCYCLEGRAKIHTEKPHAAKPRITKEANETTTEWLMAAEGKCEFDGSQVQRNSWGADTLQRKMNHEGFQQTNIMLLDIWCRIHTLGLCGRNERF